MHAKSFQSCLILCDPMDCGLPGSSLRLWNFPGKNIRVGCHCLLQGIFLTQGSNPSFLCLLLWQVGSFNTSTTWEAQTHQGPTINKTKIQSTDQEKNIYKRCNQQGLNFQHIQTAHTARYQKQTNNSMKKMGRGLLWWFSD